MIEEILETLNTDFIILPFYLITWLIAVIQYRTYYDTILKYHPIYLMYTLLTELLGYLVKYTDSFQLVSDDRYHWYNVIIYNIYSVVTYMYFFYIYWNVLSSEKHKKWVTYGGCMSMASFLISLFFQNPNYSHLYIAELISALILLSVIALYFKEKFEWHSFKSLRYNLMFWTSVGLGIFYAYFPFTLLFLYLGPDLYTKLHLHDWLIALIFVLYGTFLVGVLFHRRRDFQ
ncbi:hypothetical protein [Flagellimonas marina]|uniref:Uncharacterized protein n=1 Tax=Flagellimonas marina TaxID=1775168 RepID=A0ABV8PHF7_9FLAO